VSRQAELKSPGYLPDTNAIIEAVRTGCWNAITGGLNVETVTQCRDECLRGDRLSTGYVAVSPADLSRLAAIHPVSEEEVAMLLLVPEAAALDRGERDLFAHAYGRSDDVWLVCSPDHASVDLGVALGWEDRLISLGDMLRLVGGRADPPFRSHFESSWLSRQRTLALLRRH
jgi:hypothetical protein